MEVAEKSTENKMVFVLAFLRFLIAIKDILNHYLQ